MNNTVNKLLIGASVWSCGYAAAAGGGIMIMEPSAVLGSEFAGAYRCDAIPMDTVLSSYGEDMRRDLIRRDLVDGRGHISIPPVTSYLASVLCRSDAPVMLMCRILSVDKTADGYSVEYYNTDGFGRIECGSVIDTTPVLPAKLSLRAILAGKTGKRADIDGYAKEGVYVLRGRFGREYILALEADGPDLPAMRRKYREKWKLLCHNDFEGWETVALASFLTYTYDGPVHIKEDVNYDKIPSASYGNLIDAYEGGVRFALRQNS